MRKIILASASPARLALLRQAGLAPEVMVSGIDETNTAAPSVAELVRVLARSKAKAVASDFEDALVIGCDSLLELDGQVLGKPLSVAEATEWWRRRAGRVGTLHTGHCVIDTASGREADAVAGTTVRFGSPTDEEIDAYVGTGEPLRSAGAFTIYGMGAWFVDAIDGDAGNVLGISLPLLRALFSDLGVSVVDLWPGTSRSDRNHDGDLPLTGALPQKTDEPRGQAS
ncbi:MAG: Maf family protein [Actinoallomurus sp.]